MYLVGVETHSFLPDRQSDRCDLPCQGETRHRRPPPFGQKSSVKLLERSRPSAGGYRQDLRDARPEQVIQPGGRSSFFESHQQAAAQPIDELQNGGIFCFQDGLQDQLTGGIHHRNRDRCLMNVHANILCLVHNGAPFGRW